MTAFPARPGRRTRAALSILLALVMLEGLSALGILVLTRAVSLEANRVSTIFAEQSARIGSLLGDGFIQLDTLVGWRHRTSYATADHKINSAGMRSHREYGPTPLPEVVRVAAFGDSFVYGSEVATEDAWSSRLEASFPQFEVLNYGVSGYGTDQAFLLFLREGTDYNPDIVLIGFAPVNVARTVNVYRRFLSVRDFPLVKPRFHSTPSGDLEHISNPLPTREDWEALQREPERALTFAANDAWFEPLIYRNPLYDLSATIRLSTAAGLRIWRRFLWKDRLMERGQLRPSSEAFRLQLSLLRSFVDSVRAREVDAVVVIFPDEASVMRGTGAATTYQPMVDSLRQDSRLRVIDLIDAFRNASANGQTDHAVWFAPIGHYSAEGNAVVSAWLGSRLGETVAPR